ncbi:MAG: EAL domain-containing protein [Ruminiclostridium sp.]|nr:EAL domain-containing protein [Ruminiclostridium sp.]
MRETELLTLYDLLKKIRTAKTTEESQRLIDEYTENVGTDSDGISDVLQEIKEIATELITLRQRNTPSDSRQKLIEMSEKQRQEFAEAERILGNNLLNYHFQPIVSAKNGAILSYEALMRPISDICPSPYHIMKYAQLGDKLDDVETATFKNVLNIIDKNTIRLNGKSVFINSIPTASIHETCWEEINILLTKHSSAVVVEMTEQSELDDDELENIKAIYKNLNVKLAIDDYGTGYSNVQNLLRYVPDIVKIDRSLISEIHNDRKKRHFVKEIVEFCHDNGIKALAEGVETSEDLRAVILIGVDLIQGYYTSRPSAEMIEAIPAEIKQEIERYRTEKEDGKRLRTYKAEKSERVSVSALAKEGYEQIIIGAYGSGDVTISSEFGSSFETRISIVNGYNGRIVIQNTELTDNKFHPCIDIGENCDVTLFVNGQNHLRGGGIRVPESSRLKVEGDGRLTITLTGDAFYAIGNDINSKHGELVFEYGVNINNHSAVGVGIGSGLGGKIIISKGQFSFNISGYQGVGIGSLTGNSIVDLFAADITMDISSQSSVAIGSMKGSFKGTIIHSSLKAFMSGSDVVGIGTLSGEHAEVNVCESALIVDAAADRCSAIAALEGDTDFEISRASLHITANGENALGIGGTKGKTRLSITNSDSIVNLTTQLNYLDYVKREDVNISGGRARFSVNGETISFEN